MKALFIGGTGNISAAVSRLALTRGVDLVLLNRGRRKVDGLDGARLITCDISKEDEAAAALGNETFDAVVQWIAYDPEDVERDIRLFSDRTRQYIFISTIAVYQKPLAHPVVTESTPLCNPYWDYGRSKIACEQRLMREYAERSFPVTIVRPGHTYDTVIPLALGGWTDYTIIDRMKQGRPVIVPGDGTSLWTVTHADDFARGFVGLLGNPQARGHTFHITSDEILTWNQIYEEVAAAAGAKANIVHIASDFIIRAGRERLGWKMEGNLLGDKAASVIFDNTKIKRFVPGYQAIIPFHEGIRRTLRWFEASPERMRVADKDNHMFDTLLEAYGALEMAK